MQGGGVRVRLALTLATGASTEGECLCQVLAIRALPTSTPSYKKAYSRKGCQHLTMLQKLVGRSLGGLKPYRAASSMVG